ncbi:MAG: restriction endonuclease subunit S [Rhodocyclaceae bacterium]|nr:restriction endonuclease subunit S [Rhodocyclaceae bacterium]
MTFQEMTLGDAVTLKRGHDLPSKSRIDGTVPIVSSSGITGFHAIAKVKGPAVVTGRYGTIGQVFYCEEDCWPLNTTLYVENFKGNDPKFVYYLLQTIDYEKYNDKAAVPGVNRNHLHTAGISLPDYDTQRRIATYLSLFDEKIELLRETNTTLEAIAQALFKSWFVDFDPVRAKAEGREPEGVPPEIARLFPCEFVESSLGKMPKGWSVQRVEDIAFKVGMGPFGSNIKVATFVSDGVPIISGQHLHETLLEDSEFNFITVEHAQKLKSSIVGRGDIVFTHAGNIGQVSLIPDDSSFSEYVLSQRQFYLRCNPEKMLPTWAVYFFRSAKGQHLLLANASQVGVPSIARPASYLKSIQLVVPDMRAIQCFDDVVTSLHAKQVSNRMSILQLEATRDAILPRLLSGKLPISSNSDQG